jgi:adenine-specific DNA-methyltransferase
MNVLEKITTYLGEPYFQGENAMIYNMDCQKGLDILRGYVEVDATITSPPYNIGKEYEKPLSLDEYIEWLSNISQSIHHITKKNGSYLLNLGYLKIEEKARAVPIPYLIWDKIPFF